MKMQILKNSRGEVVAAFEQTLTAPVSLEPKLSRGQQLVETEVPDEYLRMPAPDFIKRLQSDIKVKRLKITRKK